MITMLPVVTSLCVLVGYDSFTGFLCSERHNPGLSFLSLALCRGGYSYHGCYAAPIFPPEMCDE